MEKRKKFELHTIFSLIKKYKNAEKVSKELGISKSNLSYYTKKLKDLKVLKYSRSLGWEVFGSLEAVQKSVGTHSPLSTEFLKKNPKKEVRGHAFIWKVKMGKEFDWKKLLNNSSLKKKYKKQSNGKVLRIMLQGRKIWLQKNGTLTVFEPYDYFGVNARQSKGLAVWNLNLLLNHLLKRLNQPMCFYKFTTSRVHYAMIKNELARQLTDKKEKLCVKTEDGTEWLWIDFSKGDGELEVGNLKEEIVEDVSIGIQKFWNENKEDNFQTLRPKNIIGNFKEVWKDVGEITAVIKASSQNQINSELRIKQMDNRMRGQEELIYQLIESFRNK